MAEPEPQQAPSCLSHIIKGTPMAMQTIIAASHKINAWQARGPSATLSQDFHSRHLVTSSHSTQVCRQYLHHCSLQCVYAKWSACLYMSVCLSVCNCKAAARQDGKARCHDACVALWCSMMLHCTLVISLPVLLAGKSSELRSYDAVSPHCYVCCFWTYTGRQQV